MAVTPTVNSKAGLVDRNINTAYDTVKQVADNIGDVTIVANDIANINAAVLIDFTAAINAPTLTAADVASTNADVVTTNADVVITNADAAQTALDKVATNADVVLTAADVVTAGNSVTAAGNSAAAALVSEGNANKWAVELEDTLINATEYSAFHWAKKAQGFAAGGLTYVGTWDASTAAYPVAPAAEDFYIIDTAGTISTIPYAVGDYIIWNGTSWDTVSAPSLANLVSSINVEHTAIAAGEDALSIICDAAGFSNVNAIDINYDVNGLAAGTDDVAIALNVDKTASTGGRVLGINVDATDGSAQVIAARSGLGVDPIHQASGAFANPTFASNNTTATDVPNMRDGVDGTPTAIMVAVNDYIILGAAAAFSQLSLVLTGLSSKDILPQFFYSIAGTNLFTEFFPIDNTNGLLNTGVISWDLSLFVGHVADGVTGTFNIKIVRTRTGTITNPILGHAHSGLIVTYSWDKDGIVSLSGLSQVPIISAGTTTAITATFGLAAPKVNQVYTIQTNVAIITGVTLAIDGAAAATIIKVDASAYATGDCLADGIYNFRWDGTNWILLNPTPASITAASIPIVDLGTLYTATEVEAALQEVKLLADVGGVKANVWLPQSPAEANSWRNITWSPELAIFCAVSDNGTNQVMTSYDGIHWVARAASTTSPWNDITWSPELSLFCAVASGTFGTGKIMTSPDGITWTDRVTAGYRWNSVTWSPKLSLFCVIALDGINRVTTSPDGITWTVRTAAEANTWTSITWSPKLSLFCAVSSDGTNRVMTSPDGITWTSRSASSVKVWTSITWSPELGIFCAVSATVGSAGSMTSPDGITWTSGTDSISNAQSVAWSYTLSLFAVCLNGGTNRIFTSPDGINWTSKTTPTAFFQGITASPSLRTFVVVATGGTDQVIMSV